MKYGIVALLLVGLIGNTEAINKYSQSHNHGRHHHHEHPKYDNGHVHKYTLA